MEHVSRRAIPDSDEVRWITLGMVISGVDEWSLGHCGQLWFMEQVPDGAIAFAVIAACAWRFGARWFSYFWLAYHTISTRLPKNYNKPSQHEEKILPCVGENGKIFCMMRRDAIRHMTRHMLEEWCEQNHRDTIRFLRWTFDARSHIM